MQIANNEVALALLVAALVTGFVYGYMPPQAPIITGQDPNTGAPISAQPQRTSSVLFKSFIVSFCVAYVIFYFVHDTKGDCPIDNIYRCEPDF